MLRGRSRVRSRSLLRVEVAGLGRRQREVLAAYWRDTAELEHASIVAFHHLGRSLQLAGAPSALLEGCATAAAQEADHAARCFALASRYLGAIVTPGRLRMPRVSVPSLSTLATDSLRDGMLNEGYAAWLADRQLQGATEPEVVDTLRTIARDEANHAQLSLVVFA